MSKTTFLFKLFSLVAMLTCALSSSAYDFMVYGFYFNITGDNTVEVTYKDTNYNSYSGYVNIPSTVTNDGTDYTVSAIGEDAFYNCSYLTSVTIPNTVTTIKSSAFVNCISLTEVTVPNSVTKIGGIAFGWCSNLTTVVLGENCGFGGSYNIFLNCPKLSSITILNSQPWVYNEPMFDQSTYDNATLYVPRGKVEAFRATDYWYHFSTIREIQNNMRGDVNGDGSVGVKDVATLINYLLTNDPTGVNLNAADVDRSGNVSTSDIAALINYLLSGSWPIKTQTFTVNGVSFNMVEVNGGTFMMGAKGDDPYANEDERPAHQVTLSSYLIGQTEVTQALWDAVMDNNPSSHSPANGYSWDPNRPVEMINYSDCQDFVAELSRLTGKPFRLLTEAEWEFAARGGNESQGYLHSGSNDLDAVAWNPDNSDWTTHAVGTKAPNELGIYDMDGNVEEWVRDLYGPYSGAAQENPIGTTTGNDIVVRGSSYSMLTQSVTTRYYSYGGSSGESRGLRIALDPDDSPKFRLSPSALKMEQGRTATVSILNGSGNYTIWSRYGNAIGIVSGNTLIVTGVGESSYEMLFVTDDVSGAITVLNLDITESMTLTYTANGVSFNMKKVKSGIFVMGSDDNDDVALNHEKPSHRVWLDEYAIGETEVTQELWLAVMGDNPSYFSTRNGYPENLSHPVECVSWDECQRFIYKLNQLTGQKFRLPTEAEWEVAASGGRQTKGYRYSGSNSMYEVGWFGSNIPSTTPNTVGYGTQPVATKAPNELGIYDMSGNVFEWVLDWYGPYSSNSSNYQMHPTGATSGTKRVYRGGSWSQRSDSCRVKARFARNGNPALYGPENGLRLALDLGNYNYTLRFSQPIVEVAVGESLTVDILNYSSTGNYSITGGTECAQSTLNGNKLTVTGTATGVTTVHLINSKNNTTAILTVIVRRPPKETFTVNGVSFNMVNVDGGSFMMGTNDNDPEADSAERPVHRVTLSDYSIGETEVTVALWRAVMGSNPSTVYEDANFPATRLSWDECQTFVAKLNELTGRSFRLPSEAEWEFAARGGRYTHGYKYAGSNNLSDVATLIYDEEDDEYYNTVVPVASKLPNELGIYDMSGNVDEWVQDYFGFYSSAYQTNPVGPTSYPDYLTEFVIRTGPVWNREGLECDLVYKSLGFRLALDPTDSEKIHLAKGAVTLEIGQSATVHISGGVSSYSIAAIGLIYNNECVSGTVTVNNLTVTGTALGTSIIFVQDAAGNKAPLTVVVIPSTGEYSTLDDGTPATTGQPTNDHLFVRREADGPEYDNTVSALSQSTPQLVWFWLDDDEIYQNQAIQALTPMAYDQNGNLYNEITYSTVQCDIYLPQGVEIVNGIHDDGEEVEYEQGNRLPNTTPLRWGRIYDDVTVDGIPYNKYRVICYNVNDYGNHFSSKNATMYRNRGALKKDDAALFGLYLQCTSNSPYYLNDMIIANTEFVVQEALPLSMNQCRFFYGTGGNQVTQRFQKYVRVKLSRY